ncbi:MAG: peptide-methionine (S)-S-oxide reductase MsrA [Bacteroidales bacterium]|nr:peptide-methionine (S)-S-oxide reductase MsrA [Bacteroidales bacterium]
MKKLILLLLTVLLFNENIYPSDMKNHDPDKVKTDTATFAGGCFWCTEAIFERVEGVSSVMSGYSGGHVINPGYREVTKGNTGHAETIRILYDPDIVSYEELLEIFFRTHDPTTLNRQGADVGPQYRSAVFYHSEEQKKSVNEIIAMLNDGGIWNDPIVTEVSEFKNFYPAEEYHQEYFENNPNQGYCRIVIQPKIEKFNKLFKDKLKK